MKLDQLAYSTPAAVKARSSKVRVTHLGTEFVDGLGDEGLTDIFAVSSKSENYLAWVHINEKDQCTVSCACAYFKYILEVALANAGASVVLYSNGDAPVEKNPLQRKFLCKHLYKVWLGKNTYKLGYHSPDEELEEEPIEEEIPEEEPIEEEPELEPEPEPEEEEQEEEPDEEEPPPPGTVPK